MTKVETNPEQAPVSSGLKRSTAITSSFKVINYGQRWKNILRSGDKFMQTIKLEGVYENRNRYLCIVNHQDEYCLLGVDEEVVDKSKIINSSIGLVCKIVHGMSFYLDGDGGFTYQDINGDQYIFKPVSVQALWTVIQTLHSIAKSLIWRETNFKNDKVEDWVEINYVRRLNSSQSCINEWLYMADVLVRRPPSPHRTPNDSIDFETVMKNELRRIMKTSNLDTITSKKIRKELEQDLNQNLEDYKSFIDKEILLILGQMDSASQILEHLYLGSEWNASNLEELHTNGITHILNVTREIDNFFPGEFKYKNIRVYDEESTDLLRFFDDTYKFIKEAKDCNGKVLVHCKMGISRSATITICYLMKEYSKDLKSALQHAKQRRSIVNPNKSFLKQLEVYEGILTAFKNRSSYPGEDLSSSGRLFRSKSVTSIPKEIPKKTTIDMPDSSRLSCPVNIGSVSRPKSWSPNDKMAHFLLDQTDHHRISKSATADNVIDNQDSCQCLTDQLIMQVPTSPVNSAVCNAIIDPNCECNVELELSVPNEPVSVEAIHEDDDVTTNVIVQSLSQLPIQMRSSSNSQGGSVSSSVSSTTSVPTTPIFELKRRSSVDSSGMILGTPKILPSPPKAPPLPKSEVLSVKTLANMFDFKVKIPFRPCCARLEDNHIFQRMAKQLENDNGNAVPTETDC